MKDHLQDIVQNIQGLGNIDSVKITGTDTETVLSTISEDRSVIVQARFHNPVPEFIGTFGLPALGKLKTILDIPEYREDATISIERRDIDGEEVPASITFENKIADFTNTYRLMTPALVNEKLKNLKFKGANWDVEFTPSVASIQRLKFQAQATSGENCFSARTEKNNLKFYFGDHSTYAGNFVFHAGVSGKLSKDWKWPVGAFSSVLNLVGDKTIKISDAGVSMITVKTGMAEYEFILPGMTK
jgi:hypothetical protein